MKKNGFASVQRGFSLVELMIAMLIGLVLLAGMAQIMQSSRQSFGLQSGMGRVQENGRFAISFLQRDIGMAGFPLSDQVMPFELGNTLEGSPGASDEIAIQFNPAPGMNTDCLGNTDNIAPVTSHYYVALSNGISSLMCLGSGNLVAQPIASNVQSLQVLYGEDTDDDRYANVYRTRTAVADWAQVVSVRVAILVDSGEPVMDEPDTTQYAVLNALLYTPVNDPATPINELLFRRRVFTSTIELRNRTP